MVFVYYLALGAGFALGVFTFSGILTKLFQKARHTAYSMIVGLSLGSILSMFFNADILSVYTAWIADGIVIPDFVTGIVLLGVGIVLSYLLVRYQRKKDEETS